MSQRKSVNPFLKTNNDTGFSSGKENQSGRFVNKNGTFNVKKQGISIWKRWSLYHSMLNMPMWRFILTLFVGYLAVNVVYTSLYFVIGIGGIDGIKGITTWKKIKEVFFFSTETFTTVGYGRVNPIGDGVNMLAAIEAMTGFLSFAMATGLMYGRFSKAKAHVIFSENAVFAPYRNIKGLMFRVASFKNHHTLTNVTVTVTASMLVTEDNAATSYKFFQLPLERNRIDSLMMNWTVVHPIDEESPFYNLTEEDLDASDLEIFVHLQGYDDIYSSMVLKRTSYTFEEIIFDAKFSLMHRDSADRSTTIVDLDKLNAIEKIKT